MDPDIELARAAREGDRSAFVTLVERHQRSAYNIALRMLRDREAALDLTQEAFLRAFEHRRAYDPTRPFGPWLYKIVTNLALNELKRRRPAPRADLDPTDPAAQPPEVARSRLAHQRLREAVDALEEKYRLPFVLRYLEERPCHDVAQLLGCPVNTVKIRLFRAREILRQRLGPHLAEKEARDG